jgi:hypothetical protein
MHVMHVMFWAFCFCVLRLRETCFTEGKKVSKRESNLWITFLLPFWHDGNVGNVRHGFEVAPALEHTRPTKQTISI